MDSQPLMRLQSDYGDDEITKIANIAPQYITHYITTHASENLLSTRDV